MTIIAIINFRRMKLTNAPVLITVATSLLNRQLAAQAKAFEEEGGFTERLYRTRQQRRKRQ